MTIYKDLVVSKIDANRNTVSFVDENETMLKPFDECSVVAEVYAPQLLDADVRIGELFSMALYSINLD